MNYFQPTLEVAHANLVDPPVRPSEPGRYIHKLLIKNSGHTAAHGLRVVVSHGAFDGSPSVVIEPGLASTLTRTVSAATATLPVLPPGHSLVVSIFGLLAPGISAMYLDHHGSHAGPEHPGHVVVAAISCDERAGPSSTRWIDIDDFTDLELPRSFEALQFLAQGSADTTGARIAPLPMIVAGEGIRELRELFAGGQAGHVPSPGVTLINPAIDTAGTHVDCLSSDIGLVGAPLRREDNVVVWYYDLRCRRNHDMYSKIGWNIGGHADSAKWIRVGGGVWRRVVVFLIKGRD